MSLLQDDMIVLKLGHSQINYRQFWRCMRHSHHNFLQYLTKLFLLNIITLQSRCEYRNLFDYCKQWRSLGLANSQGRFRLLLRNTHYKSDMSNVSLTLCIVVGQLHVLL